MYEIKIARLMCEEFGTVQKIVMPKNSWLLSAAPTPAHGDVNLHFVCRKEVDDTEERKFLVVRNDWDGFEANIDDLMYIDTVVYHTHTLYVFEIDEEIGSWLE